MRHCEKALRIMKIRTFLSALVISSLLSFGVNTWALDDDGGDGQGDNNDDQGENCQGGHIDGSETLIATVTLVATNNAPTNSGGFAKLISENEDGVVSSSFSLCITGLTAGTYDLSVIRKSDGSSVDLGQFVVGCVGSAAKLASHWTMCRCLRISIQWTLRRSSFLMATAMSC